MFDKRPYDFSNTVFCIAGKGDIAVDVLYHLLDRVSSDRIVIVCNKTEQGVDTWQKSLRKHGNEKGVTEIQLEDIFFKRDVLFLSLEYDRIIRPEMFQSSLLYNIHFSALPEYKGMYTSALPILHGKKETGVTFHEIDRGIDTGNVILQETFGIDKEDTARDVYTKYLKHGTGIVKKALDLMLDESVILRGEPQPAEGSSYYSKGSIDYSNLQIDLNQTAEMIQNQIRAFYFPEYQIPMVYGKPIKRVIITERKSCLKAGTIIEEDALHLHVATIDYDVVLVSEIN